MLELELVSSTLILPCDFKEFFLIYNMQGTVAFKHTHMMDLGMGIVLFMLSCWS